MSGEEGRVRSDPVVGRLGSAVGPAADPHGVLGGVRDAVGRRRRRRQGIVAVLGTLGVVATLGGGLALTGDRVPVVSGTPAPGLDTQSSAPGPAACPERLGPRPVGRLWVPEGPTVLEVSERLAPAEAPAAVLICRYGTDEGADATDVPPEAIATVRPPDPAPRRWDTDALHSQGLLRSGHDRLAADLSLLPRAPGPQTCPAMAAPVTTYLIRLEYADGAGEWVATSDHICMDATTNGSFATFISVAERAKTALDTGAWAAPDEPTSPYACRVPGWFPGRAGDDVLVPSGAREVTICGEGASGEYPRARLDANAARGVLDALRSRPVEDVTDGVACPGPMKPAYVLYVTYERGPGVAVRVHPGCSPEVLSGFTRMMPDPDGAVYAAVERALEEAARTRSG